MEIVQQEMRMQLARVLSATVIVQVYGVHAWVLA
jgi:hypothetical protein